ncbi:hypothetical protein [Candidatus Protochlamydia naegleriophila]|uniref:hypothetical protein n=1 Tax=Candidatus Protochlamydia naegleriophila TaxID=389348 RepID=UPI001300EA53|nr:hypothetical protein [Candidatus Protochlamydia naegleriophila]
MRHPGGGVNKTIPLSNDSEERIFEGGFGAADKNGADNKHPVHTAEKKNFFMIDSIP